MRENWFYFILFFSFLQPARLNVFKNDQDTWDYTNPNLSGQGNTQSPTPSFPLFSSSFLSCHCMGWLGFSASGGIAFDHRRNSFLPPFTTLLNSVFRGSTPVMLSQTSCIFSPYSRHKVRAWGATSRAADLSLQAHACEKFPTHPSQYHTQAHHSSHRFTFPKEHVTAAQPHITAYFNPVHTSEAITPVSKHSGDFIRA